MSVIIDPNGMRWPTRCTCGSHPRRGHDAKPLPGAGGNALRPHRQDPTVIDTIAALVEARAVVHLDHEQRLVVEARRPLDPETDRLVRLHRFGLAWAVLGRDSGHEWLACDMCGEAQLVRPEKAGRPCHMTPRCAGRIRRSAVRLLDPRIAESWRTLA